MTNTSRRTFLAGVAWLASPKLAAVPQGPALPFEPIAGENNRARLPAALSDRPTPK